MDKSPEAFRTISEVSEVLETPAHVLRFWETRFPQIRPVKRAGGRRYYRPSDVALLSGIKRLLHEEGLTIRGVQKILREQGVRHVAGLTDDTSPEEQALDAAMVARHDEEALPASEAATAAALQAALDQPPQTNIIAFPTEVPVTLPDPRQSSFPGFEPPEPDEPMLEDLGADGQDIVELDALDAPVEDLPEAEATETLSPETDDTATGDATPAIPVEALPPADESAAAENPTAATAVADDGVTEEQSESHQGEDVAETLPAAPEPRAELSVAEEAASPPAPADQPEAAPAEATSRPADPTAPSERAAGNATLSARLRALPRGSLAEQRPALLDLSARIAALRARLGGPSQGA